MPPQLPPALELTDIYPPVVQNQDSSYYNVGGQRRPARRCNPPPRYYSLPRLSRHSEWRYKARNPGRHQPRWDNSCRRRPELRHSNSSASSGVQNATCLSSKPYAAEGSLLEQPANIPQMITPNTRENTFTEAMGGDFDLAKSHFWLGNRLTGRATFPERDPRLLHNLRKPFSSDTNSHTGSSSSTSGRSQRAAMPLQILQQNNDKNAHNTAITSPFDASRHSNSSVQSRDQSDPMTVGFGLAHSPCNIETDEFSRLLQTIELHSRQSKGLADLVSSYLEGGGNHSDINSVVGDVNKFYTKPLRRRNQNSEGNLRVASLSGGGDSPDPPRDHRTPFRGHMIDRVDPGGPVVSANRKQSDEEGGTTTHENPSEDGGSGIATEDSQGLVPSNTNPQNNYTPASCGSNCTYVAMPVHELPQDPILSTSDFGGFYDTFIPAAASDGSSSKKRSRQDIGDLCQNTSEPSVGCCHQQSKVRIDKHQSPDESQCNQDCRKCRLKRAKLARQICADRQRPLSPPLSSQSYGVHRTGTLPEVLQPFAKTYSVPVTPRCQRIYETRQKSTIVPLAAKPPNCGCRPRCLCTQPCQCGQDTNVKNGGRICHFSTTTT